MAIVFLAVGLLVTAAGFVTIGFGIPINAFSLGNTLIIAGTIGVASGLILIAMAAAIGQLRRIGEAIGRAPRMARPAESAEPVVAQPRVAPVAAPAIKPEPAPSEPRFTAPATEPAAGPLDWLRARPKPPGAASSAPPVEPPVVEVTDEAPLSPRPPPRPAEVPPDPRVWAPGRPGSAEPRAMPRSDQIMPRIPPQTPDKPDFDLVWPDRPTGMPGGEPPRREEPMMAPPPSPPPAAPSPPPAPPRARDMRIPERRPEPPKEAPKAPADRGPAILKSGVIDGMPYTLYADGSIEAELPSGTVKFASVDALRAHLEKQS